MTKGLVRYKQYGCFHFVTFSCYHRLPYLGTPTARDLFERSFETMRLRYDFVVCGYVAMPEHVHLLLSEPKRALLSKAIQALKLSVSVQRGERPFWQARYYDFNVHNEEKRVEKLRYMHRNPVMRGWSGNRKTGNGRASGTMPRVRLEPWRSSHSGPKHCGMICTNPGLKVETWGTHPIEGNRDVGHPPAIEQSLGYGA